MIPLLAAASSKGPGVWFFVALAVVITIALLLSWDPGRKDRLRRLAGQLGGTFVDGGFLFNESSIDFTIAGKNASLRFYGGSKHSPPNTRVLVDFQGRSPGTLHVLQDGFGQSFLKIFGAQDLLIGDAAFDKEYVIKATPESLAARIFSPERRSEVIRTVRRLRGFPDPSFDLDPNSLSVVVRQYLQKEEALKTLITAATEFLDHVTAISMPSGIVLGEVKTAGGGLCLVCGTGLREPLARCEQCRTPHHAECWSYLGRCATYACRGTRARA